MLYPGRFILAESVRVKLFFYDMLGSRSWGKTVWPEIFLPDVSASLNISLFIRQLNLPDMKMVFFLQKKRKRPERFAFWWALFGQIINVRLFTTYSKVRNVSRQNLNKKSIIFHIWRHMQSYFRYVYSSFWESFPTAVFFQWLGWTEPLNSMIESTIEF